MVVKINTCLGVSYQVDIDSRGVMVVTKIQTIFKIWSVSFSYFIGVLKVSINYQDSKNYKIPIWIQTC